VTDSGILFFLTEVSHMKSTHGRKSELISSLLVLLFLIPNWAAAWTTFERIVVFGTSLSNPGNAFALRGVHHTPSATNRIRCYSFPQAFRVPRAITTSVLVLGWDTSDQKRALHHSAEGSSQSDTAHKSLGHNRQSGHRKSLLALCRCTPLLQWGRLHRSFRRSLCAYNAADGV
jgi:hypothetical protein